MKESRCVDLCRHPFLSRLHTNTLPFFYLVYILVTFYTSVLNPSSRLLDLRPFPKCPSSRESFPSESSSRPRTVYVRTRIDYAPGPRPSRPGKRCNSLLLVTPGPSGGSNRDPFVHRGRRTFTPLRSTDHPASVRQESRFLLVDLCGPSSGLRLPPVPIYGGNFCLVSLH